jgi:hypothetical protein
MARSLRWPRGLVVMTSPSHGEGRRFESCRGHFYFSWLILLVLNEKKSAKNLKSVVTKE